MATRTSSSSSITIYEYEVYGCSPNWTEGERKRLEKLYAEMAKVKQKETGDE